MPSATGTGDPGQRRPHTYAELEACILERVEDTFDGVYRRYAGRQIVHRRPPIRRELPAGSLLVRLDQGARVRAALVLEPCVLYGLYQHDVFRATVADDGTLPVSRVIELDPATTMRPR